MENLLKFLWAVFYSVVFGLNIGMWAHNANAGVSGLMLMVVLFVIKEKINPEVT